MDLWNYLINKNQMTDLNISYGTVEMANSMSKILQSGFKIFAMGGHTSGVIAYGSSADEVGKIVMETFRLCRTPENNQ